MGNSRLESRISRLEKLIINEVAFRKGSKVAHGDYVATVVDSGSLNKMADKYKNRLNRENIQQYEYELMNYPAMQTVVVEFDNDNEYYVFPEDEIDLYDADELDDSTAEAVYNTANKISELCKSLAVTLKSTNDASLSDVENAISLCEDDFPKMWFDRYNRILNNK